MIAINTWGCISIFAKSFDDISHESDNLIAAWGVQEADQEPQHQDQQRNVVRE